MLGGSNHDIGRLATRWADGDEARTRCALMLLLTLRGTPCLYYGDELALEAGAVSPERVLDVADPPRDPGRTPMPWTSEGGWHDPWLPLADTIAQRRGAARRPWLDAPLHPRPHRAAASARESPPGAYTELPAPAGSWAWRRGDDVIVALNLGAEPVALAGVDGAIALSTNRSRDGEHVDGDLVLAPSEGAIVSRG